MEQRAKKLEIATSNLEWAKLYFQLCQGRYGADDWLLLAGRVGEADQILRDEQNAIPDSIASLHRAVVEEFRQETSNFTDASFCKAAKAARRDYKALFHSKS